MDLVDKYKEDPPPGLSVTGWAGALHMLQSLVDSNAYGGLDADQQVGILSNCLLNYKRFEDEGIGGE